jgi:hypothetical protein
MAFTLETLVTLQGMATAALLNPLKVLAGATGPLATAKDAMMLMWDKRLEDDDRQAGSMARRGATVGFCSAAEDVQVAHNFMRIQRVATRVRSSGI